MTIINAVKRYLKEKGLYSAVMSNVRSRFGTLNFNKDSFFTDDFYFFDTIKFAIVECGIYDVIQDYTLYGFMKQFTNNNAEINNGDTVSISTPDGKYQFEYKVMMAWYGTFEVELEDGHRIPFDRIKSINGEKFNFKNCWNLKEKYINH